MANPDHVSQLKLGVQAWNSWREHNWNVKPDLSGLDLPNEKGIRGTALWDDRTKQIDVAKANLQWTNLRAANLRGARLIEANLTEADLSGANLKGAELSGANLANTNLAQADLTDANLIRADLKNADLAQADMRAAHLSGANLNGADLSGCDLRSAQMSATYLENTNLKNADLWLANLNGANLRGADLTEANLIRADLQTADLSYADFTNADLRDADMQGANLEHAGLIGIKYERRFMRGKYQGIRGIDSSFGDAIFRRDALDQDYIDTLTSRWRRSPMIIMLWLWSLVDYGRSLFRIIWIAALVIIAFGLIFALNPDTIAHTSGIDNWFTPYYCSLITFTSLGFSNLVTAPSLSGQLLLTTEVLLGYFMLGILLSIMLQKIARRS